MMIKVIWNVLPSHYYHHPASIYFESVSYIESSLVLVWCRSVAGRLYSRKKIRLVSLCDDNVCEDMKVLHLLACVSLSVYQHAGGVSICCKRAVCRKTRDGEGELTNVSNSSKSEFARVSHFEQYL